MTITYESFIKMVKENHNEVLATAGGRATFLLQRMKDGVSFTPTSSGLPRRLDRESIETYLDFFNENNNSIKTSDYSARHRNQSYVLAIFKLILSQQSGATSLDEEMDSELNGEFGAMEGKKKMRLHRTRERSRELVNMAKAVFRQRHNRLFCQVCDFDFERFYGEPDFIEVHHLVALRDLKAQKITKLSDLAMVCANCHRMLHRGNPWPTIGQLRGKLCAFPKKK